MPVIPSNTPNPNALKFTVDATFDTPVAFSAMQSTDDPVAAPLLAIEGVVSVFMSADFVTLTKTPDGDWSAIAPQAVRILEGIYG